MTNRKTMFLILPKVGLNMVLKTINKQQLSSSISHISSWKAIPSYMFYFSILCRLQWEKKTPWWGIHHSYLFFPAFIGYLTRHNSSSVSFLFLHDDHISYNLYFLHKSQIIYPVTSIFSLNLNDQQRSDLGALIPLLESFVPLSTLILASS